MTKQNWLLYGATGYSGQLLAEHAVAAGHRPMLAGRSAAKLQPLAARLNLDYRVADLSDATALRQLVQDYALVLHAAGPFIHTAPPMVAACLQTRTHYLDITGEVPVFERHFTLDALAREAGCAVISGVGFDVVPSDCLLNLAAQRVPGATHLELAFAALGRGTSVGTANSMVELLPQAAMVRRAGQLTVIPLGSGARAVRFVRREVWAVPICWGDLATAYRSTGIPNITTYLALPRSFVRLLQIGGPVVQWLGRARWVQAGLQRLTPLAMRGPDAATRTTAAAYLWARASGPQGEAQVWLRTPEAYHFTAFTSLACVERVLAHHPCGALSPAQAFGADFVLGLPGVQFFDQLPA